MTSAWSRPKTTPNASLSAMSATTSRNAQREDPRSEATVRAEFVHAIRVPLPAARHGRRWSTRGRCGGHAAARRGEPACRGGCGLAARQPEPREPVAADELVAAGPGRAARRARGRVGGRLGGQSEVWLMSRMVRPVRGPLHMARRMESRAAGFDTGRPQRGSSAAASSAGRKRGRQPAPHAPPRAAEGEVGDGREAVLVGAQREQQVGDPVGRRQRAVLDVHAPAVHAAAARAHEQRAGLADQPDAERAALEHQAGAGVQLARLVADEVAEQPDRGPLRALAGAAAGAAARWRRAWRTAPGSPTRGRAGSQTDRAPTAARATNRNAGGDHERDGVGDGGQRPQPPAALAAGASSTRGRQ